MILFLILWAALAAYSIAALLVVTIAACRWAWSLLPESAELVARRARIEHDGELVQRGMVPGYRAPV
jgi:hypothetical protein